MPRKLRKKSSLPVPGIARETGIALVALLLLTGTAAAQQPVPGLEGVPRREEPDQRTPAERAAENYQAPGVRAGSFLIFPELELDETFNDNIYATSSGKTASFIQGVKPTLKANSQWSNHMLNFFALGALGFYSA